MDGQQIDQKTSRSIRDAIGERLKQDVRPDRSQPPSYLQRLMDELRRRDSDTAH
jgi:hypothetical protein